MVKILKEAFSVYIKSSRLCVIRDYYNRKHQHFSLLISFNFTESFAGILLIFHKIWTTFLQFHKIKKIYWFCQRLFSLIFVLSIISFSSSQFLCQILSVSLGSRKMSTIFHHNGKKYLICWSILIILIELFVGILFILDWI